MVRNKPYRRAVISPAGQLVVRLLSYRPKLAFPSTVALAIWQMIDASEDEEAQDFKYQTTMVIDRVKGADEATAIATVNRYYSEWLTPALIDAAVGELADRGEISPSAAARLRRQVEVWSTKEGAWKW